jgi:hypothetical protein
LRPEGALETRACPCHFPRLSKSFLGNGQALPSRVPRLSKVAPGLFQAFPSHFQEKKIVYFFMEG